MKPVRETPQLPYPKGYDAKSLASFDQDLVKSLWTYLSELARRLNQMLPKDGSEGLTSYAVADLPTGVIGAIAYASNGRKSGEGAGSGTGILVFRDATGWKTSDTATAVAA